MFLSTNETSPRDPRIMGVVGGGATPSKIWQEQEKTHLSVKITYILTSVLGPRKAQNVGTSRCFSSDNSKHNVSLQ